MKAATMRQITADGGENLRTKSSWEQGKPCSLFLFNHKFRVQWPKDSLGIVLQVLPKNLISQNIQIIGYVGLRIGPSGNCNDD